MIYVFSDGSSLTPNGIGGWAFVAITGFRDPWQIRVTKRVGDILHSDSAGRPKTTNNRMEMAGANEGLKYILLEHGPDQPVTLVTDSLYVIKGITEWRKKWEKNDFRGSTGVTVRNKDIWEHVFRTVDTFSAPITFKHIKGHRGYYWNEYVDKMARSAADTVRETQQGW